MSTSTPLPPSQKVTPLGIAMLAQIQAGSLDPKTLTKDKRQLCVRFLMHEGKYSSYEMATILDVDRSTIMRDRKEIRNENALAQLVIDEADIAIEMIEAAEFAATKLIGQKKYKDAWTVRKECLEKLQSMGYVKKVEEKLNIKGKLDLLSVLNAAREMDPESPDNGEELLLNGHSNGNGHSGTDASGGSRVEQIPE